MLNANNATPLNVVVSAASSPLGREIVRQLVARGHVVTGLTENSDGAAKVRADGGLPAYPNLLRAGEIKSVLKMAKPDAVVQLPPQIAYAFSNDKIAWDELQNSVTQSANAFIQAISEANSEDRSIAYIYVSSTSVYGDTHGEWVDEHHETKSSSAVNALAQAEKAVLGSKVRATVLRSGFVYGGDEQGTMSLSEAITRGRGAFLGDNHAYHNWVYVSDLARAVVLAVEQQPAGEIFNIVDNTPVSAVEFANYLSQGIGLPAPSNSATLPEFARRLRVTPSQESLLNASVRAKNDKAKNALGWSPRYGDYKAGIEQTLLTQRAEMAK